MYLVNEVKKGHDLPQTLSAEMMPPTLRPKPVPGADPAGSLVSCASGGECSWAAVAQRPVT